MEYKIHDLPGYVKDGASKAVLNDDPAGLAAYRAKKKKDSDFKALSERINKFEDRFDALIGLVQKLVDESEKR